MLLLLLLAATQKAPHTYQQQQQQQGPWSSHGPCQQLLRWSRKPADTWMRLTALPWWWISSRRLCCRLVRQAMGPNLKLGHPATWLSM